MVSTFERFFREPLVLVGVIVVTFILNHVIPLEFNQYGIRPRSLSGLTGVPLSPFLHGNIKHLFNNIVPLFVLASFVRSLGKQAFIFNTAGLILLSGLLTWTISSSGVVIGASGLVFAYWSYLISIAIRRKTLLTALLAIITIILYGGLIYSLASLQPGISWAGHFSGVVAGLTLGLCWRKR